MEILAPAGDFETVIAATRAGADAVYLGLEAFNARRNAKNFNDGSLKDAVAYCHIRNVKVYLTLNTLVYEKELDLALETALSGAKAGIDGIIIADLGLASLLKKMLPEIPLHASTQLSIHTPDALPILKKLGFSRVVPAREMSATELKGFIEIAHSLDIEVEVFVHGALCMCLSGQCLMSANLGGRSGNRGLCAGTCRLPFGTTDRDGYALSLKDLSLINHIPQLKSLSVDSLKIEGRMKPEEYAAVAVSACREMLDKGSVASEKQRLLEGIFSRSGFTDNYFEGKINPSLFGRRTDEALTLTRDNKNKSHELYRNERQSVPINVALKCREGAETELCLSDGKNTVIKKGSPPERAINIPLTENFLLSKLNKFGGTPFLPKSFEIQLDEGLSLPMSVINQLRRAAVEELISLRGKLPIFEYESVKLAKNEPRKKRELKLIAKFRRLKDFEGCRNFGCISAVILPAEELIDSPKSDLPIIADIPAGMSDEGTILECIENARRNASALLCRNLSAIRLAEESGMPFIAGSELNILNSFSLSTLKGEGAAAAIASTECRLLELEGFPDIIPIGLELYGSSRLMLTRACPLKKNGCKNCQHKIIDRKAAEFPVFCRCGYSEIYNSVPIYLADRLHEFSFLDFGILSFITESPKEIEGIIAQYSKALPPSPPKAYTRGLYYKGVL